jgi:hypothetical protein
MNHPLPRGGFEKVSAAGESGDKVFDETTLLYPLSYGRIKE